MTWPLYEIRVLNEYSVQEIAQRSSIPLADLRSQMFEAANRGELVIKAWIPKHNAKWLEENLMAICERLEMLPHEFRTYLARDMEETVDQHRAHVMMWRGDLRGV